MFYRSTFFHVVPTICWYSCDYEFLSSDRKVQEALERQNRDNFKKSTDDKRKIDEATEKAKELMRVWSMF